VKLIPMGLSQLSSSCCYALALVTVPAQSRGGTPKIIDLSPRWPAEPCIAAGGDVCLLVGARGELPRRPDQPSPRLRVLGLSSTLAGHGLHCGCSVCGCTARLIVCRSVTAGHAVAAQAANAAIRSGGHRCQHRCKCLLEVTGK